MEKIMQNKTAVKIICTLLAVVLWFYVSYQENPTMTKELKNIPIVLTGEQALHEKGLSVYSVSDSSISVTANAKRLTLARLSNRNTTGTINVSSYKKPGTYSVYVSVNSTVTTDSIFTRSKVVTIKIEPITTKTFDIEVKHTESKDHETKVKSVRVSENRITVKAPESILNHVSRVETEALTPGKDKKAAKVLAYDENGNVLEGVECSPAVVDVSFSYYASKNVPDSLSNLPHKYLSHLIFGYCT